MAQLVSSGDIDNEEGRMVLVVILMSFLLLFLLLGMSYLIREVQSLRSAVLHISQHLPEESRKQLLRIISDTNRGGKNGRDQSV